MVFSRQAALSATPSFPSYNCWFYSNFGDEKPPLGVRRPAVPRTQLATLRELATDIVEITNNSNNDVTSNQVIKYIEECHSSPASFCMQCSW